MPFIPDDDQPFGYSPVALPDGYAVTPEAPASEPAPSVGETFGSAYNLENEVVGAIKALDHETNFGDWDDAHNPWNTIRGTELEPYHEAFIGSRNQRETDHLAGVIRDEISNRKILERSNPALAFAATGAAALTSPTTFLPGGAIFKGYKAGKAASAALKSAGYVGAANAAAAGIQEGLLHSQQYTRTGMESAYAIGGSFLLGSVLGGAVSGISSAKFTSLTKKLEGELNIGPRIDEAVASRMAGAAGQPVGGVSVGAAAAQGPKADLAPAFGLEKTVIKVDPVGRTMNASSPAAREIETQLVELPLELTRNAEGFPTAPRGGSVESRIKTQGVAREGQALQAVHQAYAQYRFGDANTKLTGFKAMMQPDKTKLSERDFNIEVGKAMARGDAHDIPEVAQAAKAVRQSLIDPLADAAVKYKLLSAEVVKKNRPPPAATVGEVKAPADAPAKADVTTRHNIDSLLARIEDMKIMGDQKIDPNMRSFIIDTIAANEDMASRLRELATGEADIPFAARAPVAGRRTDDMAADLADGHPVSVDRGVIDAVHQAVQDVRLTLPVAARDVPVQVMLGAEPLGGDLVRLSFRGIDGGFRQFDLSIEQFASARAFAVDGRIYLTGGDFVGGVGQSLAGEIRHELVHALRALRRIDDAVFSRLVGHAKSLGVLDMPTRDFLLAIGDRQAARATSRSIGEVYRDLYAGSKRNIDELLDEEAVAHMVELREHGKLTDEQLAPVLADLDSLFGRSVPAGSARDAAVSDWLRELGGAVRADADGGVMFATRDAETGQSMLAAQDSLGYYSGAIEAAKRLRQAKGTPEQMLAMLKKEGAKDSELEATGLDKFLADRSPALADADQARRASIAEIIRACKS